MLKLFKKKGFNQFIIRSAIFFGSLIMLQMGIFLIVSKTAFFQSYLAIPEDFYIPLLYGLNKQNFLSSIFFVTVAFFFWRKKEIMGFSKYKQDRRQTIIFGSVSLLFFVLHYVLKYFINMNLEAALLYVMPLTLLKGALNLGFIIFLGFAVYNKEFIISFIKRFYKDIGVFAVILFLYYELIWWFQDSWEFFSNTVGNVLHFVFLRLSDNVVFRISGDVGPILGVENFYIAISKVCSGIESLLFFISLFAILVITNWEELDKKRMMILFVPGVIGTFFVNILRVFLLVVIGAWISPKFAVDVFHTNAGWIFFLAYFIVFWHFGSKWVIRKKKSS